MRLNERWILVAIACCAFVAAVVVSARRAAEQRTEKAPRSETAPAGGLARDAEADVLAVIHATRTDGKWLVADDRARRVHLLDSLGALLTSFGRDGSGPGGLQGPTAVAVSGAEVAVADGYRSEVQVFGLDGTFLRRERARGGCAPGDVVALASNSAAYYILRRCLELPRRIRYQLERSLAGGALEVIEPLALESISPRRGMILLHFPLLAAGEDVVVVGEGTDGCLRAFPTSARGRAGERCITEFPRIVAPAAEGEDLFRWSGDGIEVPEELPVIRGLAVRDSSLAVQVVHDLETSSWFEVPWTAGAWPPRRLSPRRPGESFYADGWVLLAEDAEDGVRLELRPADG